LNWLAAVLDRSTDDPGAQERIEAALSAALQIAPFDAAVRAARSRRLREEYVTGRIEPRDLGHSRDVLPLLESAHRLLRIDRKEDALALYRQAFDLLVRDHTLEHRTPDFLNPPASRFALPRESLAHTVIEDLTEQKQLTYADWAAILPNEGAIHLAAYRVLRNRNQPESTRAFEALVSLQPTEDPARASIILAAQSEGLATSGRWEHAVTPYRDAIDRQPELPLRRTWWYNLARIHGHLHQTTEMRAAWFAARGDQPDDPIGRRALRGLAQFGGPSDVRSDAERSRSTIRAN
jgi:tetratricopeptide (TPR) repeat protein